MKQYITKFKELWSNKRERAFVILGLYFVFFLTIFILFSGNRKISQPKEETLHGLELYKTVTNYEYQVTGKQNFRVTVNQKITITYLNQIYSLENIPEELKDFNFQINFYDMIKNGVLASTNYIENKNTYLYEENTIDVYLRDQDIVRIIGYLGEYTVELEVDYDRTY